MRLMLIVLLTLAALPAPVTAKDGCSSLVASVCTDTSNTAPGFRTIRLPPRPPPYVAGDDFPIADHSPLLNPERYGLPPARDGWRYYRVRPWVFRVDTATGRVIDVVTDGNRRLLR